MISKIQYEQLEWSQRNFGDQPAWKPLLGIIEEVGELAHAHLKQSQNIRMNEDHVANAKDAIGDVVIYIMDYCNRRGFDLQEIIETTWAEVKKRDWRKK